MKATDPDIVWRSLLAVFCTTPCAVLCLTLASTIVLAADRVTLTGQLVPVTGETSRSVDLAVPFPKNSANLTEEARKQLTELGAALAGDKLAAYNVGVYGHTDASGAAAYNLSLSQERAKAVARYLIENFGFEAIRFQHEGYGEERLLEGVAPYDAAHRRVEIVVFAPRFQDPATAGETDMFGESLGDLDREESDANAGDELSGYQPIE